MHVKDITATVSRVKAVSVGVGGFIGRHKRASIAVGAALLLAGPLVTGDGELVFLNAVGLGFGALLLRRFARPNGRQRTVIRGTCPWCGSWAGSWLRRTCGPCSCGCPTPWRLPEWRGPEA